MASSSSLIFASTISFISGVIFEGRPEPGLRISEPVSLNLAINLATPTLDVRRCSFRSSKHIVGGR